MSCPICHKPTQAATRPFCSKRCSDVDLSRWLNGSYAVPSQAPEDDEALDAALRDADTGQGPKTQH